MSGGRVVFKPDIGLGHSDARDATQRGGGQILNWGYIIYEKPQPEFQ